MEDEKQCPQEVRLDNMDRDPNRPDTFWSIGFRTSRSGYAIKYVLLPMAVFIVFVLIPFYIYAPQMFSSEIFDAMSGHDRAEFIAKLPVALMIVVIPFTLSVAMLIVGQIRRFHDMNMPGWLCMISAVPFAILGVTVLLCAMPGTKGPNRFGEDPVKRRMRECACAAISRRK